MKTLWDFKTCCKTLRQSWPKKCPKCVIRRLHATKSYHVKVAKVPDIPEPQPLQIALSYYVVMTLACPAMSYALIVWENRLRT